MRKVLLLALLMAGVSLVKAQIVIPSRVADTLSSNLFKNYSKKKLDTLKKQFLKPFKWNPNTATHIDNRLAMAEPNVSPVDHMPIARLHINSNMPVSKPNINSKMPVIDPRGNQRPDVLKPFGDNSK